MIGYCWNFNRYNVYDRGEAWRSGDSGATWEIREDPPDWVGLDYCFITYGLDEPPNVPTIDGLARGKAGGAYDYDFVTLEPDSDKVYYFIDWGDNNNSSWIGPYSSGVLISESHTWSKNGTYIIKAKAKDSYGAESAWSEPFVVQIINESQLKKTWMVGLINNVTQNEEFTYFNANQMWSVSFNPFNFTRYQSHELLLTSNDYLGKIGSRFIIGRFNALVLSAEVCRYSRALETNWMKMII
jgi:hypothetical protein